MKKTKQIKGTGSLCVAWIMSVLIFAGSFSYIKDHKVISPEAIITAVMTLAQTAISHQPELENKHLMAEVKAEGAEEACQPFIKPSTFLSAIILVFCIISGISLFIYSRMLLERFNAHMKWT